MQAFTAGLIAQNLIEAMAVQAGIEGMKAENKVREYMGQHPAYTESAFQEKAQHLFSLANHALEAGKRE